jgi:hypothetical protein
MRGSDGGELGLPALGTLLISIERDRLDGDSVFTSG